MDALLKLVAERLRMRRQIEGLRIKAVAEKLGVTPSYISAIELGKSRLSLKMYLSLCDIYELNPGDFLNAVIMEYETGTPQMEIVVFAGTMRN